MRPTCLLPSLFPGSLQSFIRPLSCVATPLTPNTMGDVTLWCLLQGQQLNLSFNVTITRKSYVADLKKLVIAQGGNQMKGISHEDFHLYRISVANDTELEQLDLKNCSLLSPRTRIYSVFPEDPEENDYILVVNGMMLQVYGLIYAHLLKA